MPGAGTSGGPERSGAGAREERPGNYAEQARTYDLTRGASPTVVRAVGRFLGPGGGRRLLDVAGGTGNYAGALAARGFDVVILDAQVEMLARSVPKVGPGRQVLGDARALPFADGAADCAMTISAMHLVGDAAGALAEARRVVREGPYVLQAFTRETLASCFAYEYFPGSDQQLREHPLAAEIEEVLRSAGFSRVEAERFVYLDSVDGTFPALHTDPFRLAGPAYLRNTSFLQRLPEEVRREGLARLARDLRSGTLERRVRQARSEAVRTGDGMVFAAWP